MTFHFCCKDDGWYLYKNISYMTVCTISSVGIISRTTSFLKVSLQ